MLKDPLSLEFELEAKAKAIVATHPGNFDEAARIQGLDDLTQNYYRQAMKSTLVSSTAFLLNSVYLYGANKIPEGVQNKTLQFVENSVSTTPYLICTVLLATYAIQNVLVTNTMRKNVALAEERKSHYS